MHIDMGAMGILFVIIMTLTARRNQAMILESLTLHQASSSNLQAPEYSEPDTH
ncbi:MAG: hypothetical protein WD032_03550 [Nitrospirales bacterium]